MVDARRVLFLSSFFYFFRSKFQILFIFTNSQKVFCIYVPNIGATMVTLRRFFTKSSKKLKKIAQFFNKIFVQFSQKYFTSALHRIKALHFTVLKSCCRPQTTPYGLDPQLFGPPIWRRLLVVWPHMRLARGCLIPLYGGSRQLFDT